MKTLRRVVQGLRPVLTLGLSKWLSTALWLVLFLLFVQMAEAQEPTFYTGDSSDAKPGGSHQVIVTQVGTKTCTKTTFEGGGQITDIHPEAGNLIPGTVMRFPGWQTLTSGNYANNPSVPTIAFWITGGTSRDVTFDQPVSRVSFFYASFPNVTLQAFNAANNLVASVFGPSNFTNTFNVWSPLAVDVGQNIITRVRIFGNNNQTGIDDFEYCISTPCPSNLAISGAVPNFCQGTSQTISLTLTGSNLTGAAVNWSLSGPVSNPSLGTGTTLNTTVSGLPPGTYTITATANKSGCPPASASTDFAVHPSPKVSISGPPQVCQFDLATLTANAAGGTPPFTFSWSTGATTQSISANTSSAGTFSFSVTVTDAHGCTASATKTLTVNPKPTFSQSLPGAQNVNICSPLLMNNEDFNVAANNLQNWFIEANASGTLTLNVFARSVNPTGESGTVTFTVFDPSGSAVGTATLTYPADPGGSVPPGSESSSTISVSGTSAGSIYRLQVQLGPQTFSGTNIAHHYRFDIAGAIQAAVCSPSINNFEAQLARWGVNVNSAEGLHVQILQGNILGVTQATVSVIDPSGTTFFNGTVSVPGPIVSLTAAAVGQWTIEVSQVNGHYRLDKQTGSDRGIYLTDTPPKVTCPPNVSVAEQLSNGVPSGFAVVTFPTPVATDNFPGVTVACSPPSGSFPVGTTTVTCTATDACGNTATCTFDVTVRKIVCFTTVTVAGNFTGKGFSQSKQVPVQNAKVIMLPKGPVQAVVQNLLDSKSVWANLSAINTIGDPVVTTDATGKVVAVTTVPDPNGWAIYTDLMNATAVGVTAPPITAGSTEIAVANTDCAPGKRFTVKLEIVNGVTTVTYDRQSNINTAMGHTGEEEAIIAAETAFMPTSYALHEAFPNPFNPMTTIMYDVPEPSPVSLKVFDMLGREVVELVQGHQQAGRHSVQFNADQLPSGVYIYRLAAGKFIGTKRMILMR